MEDGARSLPSTSEAQIHQAYRRRLPCSLFRGLPARIVERLLDITNAFLNLAYYLFRSTFYLLRLVTRQLSELLLCLAS